ncbi:Putative flippase GtrA (transmembrane translocase of bactoprenol-linked glucose) [Eubacterium ruminantium]|nr:Putative flippase GtrA (transmembrane translocase of bactoprenol-linked glucose) [Eubacterium ruminantium]
MTKNDIKKDNKIWYLISVICFYMLKALYRIIGRELTVEKYEKFMQFVKFCIVGLSNTIISYVTYTISLYIFQKNGLIPDYDYLVSSVVGFVFSIIWSFYWNYKKVFAEEGEEAKDKKKGSWIPAFIKMLISYSFTGFIVGNGLLIFWVRVVHISKYIAPLINLIIVIPMNFIINKFWAFKKKNTETEKKE